MWRSISYIRMHPLPWAEGTTLQLCEITEGAVNIKPELQEVPLAA